MLLLWDIEALRLNRLNSLSCWMVKVPIDVCIHVPYYYTHTYLRVSPVGVVFTKALVLFV